eukprot:3321153-Rhodomonas_salina.2
MLKTEKRAARNYPTMTVLGGSDPLPVDGEEGEPGHTEWSEKLEIANMNVSHLISRATPGKGEVRACLREVERHVWLLRDDIRVGPRGSRGCRRADVMSGGFVGGDAAFGLHVDGLIGLSVLRECTPRAKGC